MPGGYWWECEKCGKEFDFRRACNSPGVAHYIQDFLKRDWNQDLLLKDCPDCHAHSLRIAYEFPQKKRQSFRVFNVVGIAFENGAYIPMMWVTKESPYDGEMIYDFKYICGRNPFGLNRAAVLSRGDLKRIFDLYCERTGMSAFP